jgi:protoheme ferro-lyase
MQSDKMGWNEMEKAQKESLHDDMKWQGNLIMSPYYNQPLYNQNVTKTILNKRANKGERIRIIFIAHIYHIQ